MRNALCWVIALWIAASPCTAELQVFAASSLTESFKEVGKLYQARTRAAVTFNFGATSELRMQIEHGARADVFAAASQEEMDKAVASGLVAEPKVFARNRLVLIVPRTNPGHVKSLADLARPGLRIVTTHPNVPVGKYTQAVLEKMAADAGYGAAYRDAVKKNFASLEINVKQVCAKVSLGEADAGFVYYSDVTAKLGQTVQALEIPERFNVTASYPLAVVKASRQADAARAFVDFLLTAEAQEVLGRFNFGAVK